LCCFSWRYNLILFISEMNDKKKCPEKVYNIFGRSKATIYFFVPFVWEKKNQTFEVNMHKIKCWSYIIHVDHAVDLLSIHWKIYYSTMSSSVNYFLNYGIPEITVFKSEISANYCIDCHNLFHLLSSNNFQTIWILWSLHRIWIPECQPGTQTTLKT